MQPPMTLHFKHLTAFNTSAITIQGTQVHWKIVGDHMMVATDTDQQGTPPPRSDHLARVVAALTHKSKGTFLQWRGIDIPDIDESVPISEVS